MAIIGSGSQTFVETGADTSGSNTQRDLFLKKFSGETLATFNTRTVAKNYIRIRNVQGQKSAQFPAIGKAAADYHQPGEVIDGQTIKHGEVVINIDDLLVSPVFVSNFIEAMQHFETRGEYARQMGDSLAQAYDKKVFALATNACASGTSGPTADHGSASKIDIGASPTISDFVDACYQAQTEMDENDIPEMDRVLFITPKMYYDLVDDGRFLNRDYGNANGSQADASILKVAGLPVVKTNNMAVDHTSLNVEREGSTVADFNYNASSFKGLVLQRQALGAVHLMDVSTEAEYKLERQGTLMVSKMANGMGVLRPDCLKGIDAV